MTKKQIVEETIEYYKTNPRGIELNYQMCQYWTDEGNMCAIGRCLKEPKKFENHLDENALELTDVDLEQFLKPEYLGHDINFWVQLQMFHDENFNWNKNDKGGQDITDYGEAFIRQKLQPLYEK